MVDTKNVRQTNLFNYQVQVLQLTLKNKLFDDMLSIRIDKHHTIFAQAVDCVVMILQCGYPGFIPFTVIIYQHTKKFSPPLSDLTRLGTP